jgi:hypothetical protein
LILLNGASLGTHVLAGVLNILSREYDFEGGRAAIS